MADYDTHMPLDRRLVMPVRHRPDDAASPNRSVARRRREPHLKQAASPVRASAFLFTMAWGAAALAAPPSLQPMTLAQVMDAGAGGTGCSWSVVDDRRMRFAAAGDRAAIRLNGRIVVLSTTLSARDLFPFTFADWQAKGLTVGIRQLGAARRQSTEAMTAPASLTLTVQGVSKRLRGVMSCGS